MVECVLDANRILSAKTLQYPNIKNILSPSKIPLLK
jgi:hypothetical protein